MNVTKKGGKLEVESIGQIPTLIIAEIRGRLALNDVVKDLAGLSIPGLLDQSIEDFKVRIAAKPSTTIEGEAIAPGLSLMGTFGIVELEMFVKIVVDPASGVYAHGALKRKVDVGGVFKVSDATGDGPPSMTLDTTSSPILKLTGRAELLGLSQSIDATVEATGFSVCSDQDVGLALDKVNARLFLAGRRVGRRRMPLRDRPRHTPDPAHGDPQRRLPEDQHGFVGAIALAVKDRSFSAVVTGGFRWNGEDYKIKPIHFSVAPSSLSEIPGLIDEAIRKNAATLFASVLNDGGRWLKALADGLVTGVPNAAEVLARSTSRTPGRSPTACKTRCTRRLARWRVHCTASRTTSARWQAQLYGNATTDLGAIAVGLYGVKNDLNQVAIALYNNASKDSVQLATGLGRCTGDFGAVARACPAPA